MAVNRALYTRDTLLLHRHWSHELLLESHDPLVGLHDTPTVEQILYTLDKLNIQSSTMIFSVWPNLVIDFTASLRASANLGSEP